MMAARYGRLLPLNPHVAGSIGFGDAGPPSTDAGIGERMGSRRGGNIDGKGHGIISAVSCGIMVCGVCTGCGATGRGAGGQGLGGLKDSCHGIYIVVLGRGIKYGAANRG